MPTCVQRLGAIVQSGGLGSTLVRGVATGLAGGNVTIDGMTMPYLDIGVDLAVGDVVWYIRSGTTAFALGRQAT